MTSVLQRLLSHSHLSTFSVGTDSSSISFFTTVSSPSLRMENCTWTKCSMHACLLLPFVVRLAWFSALVPKKPNTYVVPLIPHLWLWEEFVHTWWHGMCKGTEGFLLDWYLSPSMEYAMSLPKTLIYSIAIICRRREIWWQTLGPEVLSNDRASPWIIHTACALISPHAFMYSRADFFASFLTVTTHTDIAAMRLVLISSHSSKYKRAS